LLKKRLSGSWFHAPAAKPFQFSFKATTSSRGGKKMWCMADLTDEYPEKMEEVLEVYERPYNPAGPVACLDEKPVTPHDDVRSLPQTGLGRHLRRLWKS
jgi:hypothetical protein